MADYHEQALAVLQRLILHQLSRGAAILDLCCGDGRLAQALDWNGFQVMGLDGSERMLEFARERCPGLRFVAADARKFQLDCKFDAVISTFDALNHVMSPDDFAEVCRRVHEVLQPGGYFAFDLNREEAYTEMWAQTVTQVEPEMVSISAGSYDAPNRIAHCDITFSGCVSTSGRALIFVCRSTAIRSRTSSTACMPRGLPKPRCSMRPLILGCMATSGRDAATFWPVEASKRE